MSRSDQPSQPRWVPRLLLLAAVTLVPWTIALSLRLPARHTSHHWDAAWIGFDIGQGAALAAAAYAVARRRLWAQSATAMAAAFLLNDAWFDNLLASGASEHLEAGLEASLVEVPLALICLWIARNAERTETAVLAAKERLDPRRS